MRFLVGILPARFAEQVDKMFRPKYVRFKSGQVKEHPSACPYRVSPAPTACPCRLPPPPNPHAQTHVHRLAPTTTHMYHQELLARQKHHVCSGLCTELNGRPRYPFRCFAQRPVEATDYEPNFGRDNTPASWMMGTAVTVPQKFTFQVKLEGIAGLFGRSCQRRRADRSGEIV